MFPIWISFVALIANSAMLGICSAWLYDRKVKEAERPFYWTMVAVNILAIVLHIVAILRWAGQQA